MNAVEIEEPISAIAKQPFDAQELPYRFLEASGNEETPIKRLRSPTSAAFITSNCRLSRRRGFRLRC
jgi:hypothetical protein